MSFFETIRKPWVIILLVVLAGGGYLVYRNFSPKPPTFTLAKVERKAIAEHVTATGSVAPPAKYTLSSERSGMIAAIPVKIGDAVKKGDVLVMIDDREAKNALAKAKADEESAYARLKQVTNGTKMEEIYLAETTLAARRAEFNRVKSLAEANTSTATSDLSAAQNRVASAQADLDKKLAKADADIATQYANGIAILRANVGKLKQSLVVIDRIRRLYFASRDTIIHGSKIQEIEWQAEAAVNKLSAKVDAAVDQGTIDEAFAAAPEAVGKSLETIRYMRNTAIEDPLIRDTFPTAERTNIETERVTAESVDTAITNAKTAIDTQRATNDVSITNARSALQDAQSSLATAGQRQSSTNVGGLTDVTRAESAVAEAEAALKLKRSAARSSDVELALSELDATKVAVTNAEVGLSKLTIVAPADGIITDISVDVGEVVGMSTNIMPVLTMIAAPPYEIEANVAEIDIPKIKLGNEIGITFDAYPGKDFIGHVTQIYPAETVVQGVIYYRIKASFEDPELLVKPGMTANLKMTTKASESALVVPYSALTREGRKEFVKIPKGTTFETREVQIGIQGDTEVEVTSGLKEGEQVITFIKQN